MSTWAEQEAARQARVGKVSALKKGEIVFPRANDWSSKWSEFARRNSHRMGELGLRQDGVPPPPPATSPVVFTDGVVSVTLADMTQYRQEMPAGSGETWTDEEVIQAIAAEKEDAIAEGVDVEDMIEEAPGPLADVDSLVQHLQHRASYIRVLDEQITGAGYHHTTQPQTWCIGRTGKFAFARVRETSDTLVLKYEYRITTESESCWEPRELEVRKGTTFENFEAMVAFARPHTGWDNIEYRNFKLVEQESVMLYGEVHKDFMKKLTDAAFCPEA